MLPIQTPSDGPLYAQRSCWYCAWWGGHIYGIHGLCDKPGQSRVEATPRTGCAAFERLRGVDDDLRAPVVAKPALLLAPAQLRT